MPSPIPQPRVVLSRAREYMGDERLSKQITERREASISKRALSRATNIAPERLERIITRNALIGAEPFLDEAGRIAHVLNTTIRDLIAQPGEPIDWGFDTFDDVGVWRTNARLPLRVAGRLCERFGIADPIHLYEFELARRGIPLLSEVWDQLKSSARINPVRLPDTNACVWCGADTSREGAGHLPTCAPAFLFEGRTDDEQTLGVLPRPRDPRRRGPGKMTAYGIKRLCRSKGISYARLANDLGIHPNYVSQLASGHKPLTVERAEQIAALFKVKIEEVYAP